MGVAHLVTEFDVALREVSISLALVAGADVVLHPIHRRPTNPDVLHFSNHPPKTVQDDETTPCSTWAETDPPGGCSGLLSSPPTPPEILLARRV